MLSVFDLTTEGLKQPNCVDEPMPQFSWKLLSSNCDVTQNSYHIIVGNCGGVVWDSGEVVGEQSLYVKYAGKQLEPFSEYTWCVHITDNKGESVISDPAFFETGRMGTPWKAKWITTSSRRDKDDVTPTHLYRKIFEVGKKVKKAVVYVSSLGVYSLSIGGKKVGEHYFTPGYTDYKSHVQYQGYDVTSLLSTGTNSLLCEVGGGWYTGRLALVLKGNRYGKKRALILELHITYEDGAKEIIASDEGFEYTCDGPRVFAGFFDGEIYDANRENNAGWQYHKVRIYQKKAPRIVPDIGVPVKRHGRVYPVSSYVLEDSIIYKFEKNFAGIIHIEVNAPEGRVITISHAELLNKRCDIDTINLRTAKATLVYISKGGVQSYEPLFTYMGFQYIKVVGITHSQINSIFAYELYSDLETVGSFTCSNELLNQLQRNIQNSQKSNFIDIPTDNPQRDERAAWTGDIAMFSKTAVFNMKTERFMRKWLRDLRSEQLRNRGRIPFIVPSGNIFYMKLITSPIWSDAAVIVPWDVYLSSGDTRLLRENYSCMKRWVKTFIGMTTFGKLPFMKNYYVFRGFCFADWLAPDCSISDQIFKRGRWMATAYLANSVRILVDTSRVLGYKEEEETYRKLYSKVCRSFCETLLDDQNQIKDGFQSVYAVAIRFGLLPGRAREIAVNTLDKEIIRHNYHLMTGFAGTPHAPFALSDNSKKETAFRLLLQESCPSWLYSVKCGATSIWERWDAIREDGSINDSPQIGKGNMVSLNTYAFGAIGEFLYSRVAGLEALEGGYKRFRVTPLIGGGLTFAKAAHESPYGTIRVEWSIDESDVFHLFTVVPIGAIGEIELPDGQQFSAGSGEYNFQCQVPKNDIAME